MVRGLDLEPTDPVVELPRKAGQSSAWHSKECVNLVRGQLNSELQAGAGGVPKEVPPKTSVRDQATECSFHVPLAHAASQRQGSHQVSLGPKREGLGAASHVNV